MDPVFAKTSPKWVYKFGHWHGFNKWSLLLIYKPTPHHTKKIEHVLETCQVVEEGWTYLTAQQQDDMPEETPTEQQGEGEKQTPLEDKESTETREEEEEAKHEVSNKIYVLQTQCSGSVNFCVSSIHYYLNGSRSFNPQAKK
jgi:hypothetical protein